MKTTIAILLCILAEGVMAGELLLKNGDRLQGELLKLEAEQLLWLSDSFGELSIDKSRVANVQTDQALKINGHTQPCQLLGVEDGELAYHCGSKDIERLPILTLEQVLPYKDFSSGAHSYRGKLSVAGARSRGNKEEDNWELAADVEFRRGDYRNAMGIEYESESDDGASPEESYELEYELDWFFMKRWYWYNSLLVGADESRGVDDEYLVGSGFGYQFWEMERTALSLESGFLYVKERFEEPELVLPEFESSNETVSWRIATDFRYKLPRGAELFHTNDYIRSLEDGEDWRLETDTGISMPLGSGLFSEFKYEYDVDNLPSAGKHRTDSKLSVGVAYQW